MLDQTKEKTGLLEQDRPTTKIERFNEMIVTDRNPNWQVAEFSGSTDCPFCGTAMRPFPDGWECVEPMCPYTQSQDIRNVVASLQECDYEIETIAEIVNNISIDGDQNASLFIDSREKVEWALKKLAGWDAYIADVVATANAETESIQLRVQDMLKSVRNDRTNFAAFAEPQIEKFARADMAVLKKQSAKYIYGTVKVTKTQRKLKLLNSEQLGNLLLGLNRFELVKTTNTPLLEPLKAAYDDLPGMCKELIEVIPAGENVHITPMLSVAEVK